MTSQSPDFSLNRPGVLIAALPAVLGFVPEKSLVLVTVDRGEMGCVMRVDLSGELSDSVEHIAEVAATAEPDAAIAVVVDESGATCRMCNDDYNGDRGQDGVHRPVGPAAPLGGHAVTTPGCVPRAAERRGGERS